MGGHFGLLPLPNKKKFINHNNTLSKLFQAILKSKKMFNLLIKHDVKFKMVTYEQWFSKERMTG